MYRRKRSTRGRRKTYKRKRSTKRRIVRKRAGISRNYNLSGGTMQIATRVQKNLAMKFVYNNTYFYDPTPNVGQTPNVKQEMFLCGFNCNSIGDLYARGFLDGSQNYTGTWSAQDSQGPGASVDAAGFAAWQDRYTKFTVTGAKITILVKTEYHQSGYNEPCLVFLHKTGDDTPSAVLSTLSGAQNVNDLPFVTKAHIMASNLSTGVKLSQTYKPGAFEGVKGSVIGNSEYEGDMSPFQQPAVNTNWIFGICNAKGSTNQPVIGETVTPAAGLTPKLLVQVKVEYDVALTEPTTVTQPAPAPPGVPI